MTRSRPQRLFLPSPPGSLLKSLSPAQEPRKDASGQDVAYLVRVRECPCLFCGTDPCGEAAHIRFASAAFGKASGMGKRPDDKWAAPLCRHDHLDARHAQHQGNEQAFWQRLGIPILSVCEQLYAQRHDLVAMRAVIFVTIAQRSITDVR